MGKIFSKFLHGKMNICRHNNTDLQAFHIITSSPNLGEEVRSLKKERVINSCVSTVKNLTPYRPNVLTTSAKPAFTLAEVLITLAIIGIVAAMTMPSLIAKHQKQVWVNQLKKSYNTVSNALNMMMVTEGVETLENTETFRTDLIAGLPDSLLKYFSGAIRPNEDPEDSSSIYFHGPYIPMFSLGDKSNALDGLTGWDSMPYFITADGSMISITKVLGEPAVIAIDVNGNQKPNIAGRDIFYFLANNNGLVSPVGMGKYPNTWYDGDWKDDPTMCGTKGSGKINSNVTGYGCAARIMENGWKMDY